MMYMVMDRAENGQYVVDNTRTRTTIEINKRPRYPNMAIGIELAKKMKWIKMGTVQNGQARFVLGPNLRKEFPKEVVPEAVDVTRPVNNGSKE